MAKIHFLGAYLGFLSLFKGIRAGATPVPVRYVYIVIHRLGKSVVNHMYIPINTRYLVAQ